MKQLQIQTGQIINLDDEDYEDVKKYLWYLSDGVVKRSKKIYYTTNHISIACHILKVYCEVDHIDRNPLNNQKANYRLATRSENCCNRSGWSLSGLKGVDLRKARWRARIQKDGKSYWIGSFDTLEEAGRAYDAMAIKLHGKFAVLNFPNQ